MKKREPQQLQALRMMRAQDELWASTTRLASLVVPDGHWQFL